MGHTRKMGGGGCGCAAAGATQPPTSTSLGLFSGGGRTRGVKRSTAVKRSTGVKRSTAVKRSTGVKRRVKRRVKRSTRAVKRRMRGGDGWSLQPTYNGGLPNDTVIPYTSNHIDQMGVSSRLTGGKKSRKMRGGGLFSGWSASLNNVTGNGVTNVGGLADVNSSSAGLSILKNIVPPSQTMGLDKFAAPILA